MVEEQGERGGSQRHVTDGMTTGGSAVFVSFYEIQRRFKSILKEDRFPLMDFLKL